VLKSPTAQAFPADVAASPVTFTSVNGPAGLGLAARVHFRPFQCSIKVVPPSVSPTAQASRAEVAVTAFSLLPPAGAGLGTLAHFLPFQCTISVVGVPPLKYDPTAQALVAETTATPFRELPTVAGLGLATCCHAWPFQCRISVLPAGPSLVSLGSDGWAEHARAELAHLGYGRGLHTGELTAAELRVAALAAEGLSNKQIASHLFIAVHTVEVHLAHVYAKLGVRSRTQLANQLARPASPAPDAGE
jgi:DNA-binding CsgD family transcriptional regulator